MTEVGRLRGASLSITAVSIHTVTLKPKIKIGGILDISRKIWIKRKHEYSSIFSKNAFFVYQLLLATPCLVFKHC